MKLWQESAVLGALAGAYVGAVCEHYRVPYGLAVVLAFVAGGTVGFCWTTFRLRNPK